MHWLVHVWAAEADPAHRAGQVLADVVPRRDQAGLPPAVRAGIAAHLALDRAADAHPAVVASRALVPAEQRRFAGVLVDVLYGHLLARDFAAWHAAALDDFLGEVYAGWRTGGASVVPAAWSGFVSRLVTEDWLGRVRTLEGTERTLAALSARLARRFGRPVAMEAALPRLAADLDRHAALAAALWPTLRP